MYSQNIIQLIVCFILCGEQIFGSAFTEDQLHKAGVVARHSCQPKAKATDEQIDNMNKGIWDDSKESKIYTFCLLYTYQLVFPNGTFNIEGALKQLDLLPEARQEPVLSSIMHCKDRDESSYTDKYDITYYFLKCIYFDNPENYFAP